MLALRLFLSIFFSLYIISTNQGHSEEFDLTTFGATYFQLENGMDIVTIPNHRSPVVVHMVWYRVGSGDDPNGKSGLSHFLEHLMFKGTESHPSGTFSKLVAVNGGRENAFTSADYTGYFQNIAKERLPLVMKLEADRMRNLTLTENQVLLERKVILEERNTRVENVPSSMLLEQMKGALYIRHPYGTPIIGWEHEMQDLSLEDVLSFYNKHYYPNNATLVVAGDIGSSEVLELAKKYYGPIKPYKFELRKRLEEPAHVAPRRVIYKNPRVPQPNIFRSYLAPSYVSNDRSYSLPLEVLSELLGGKITSLFYQELVVKQKLATWAGTSYNPMSLDKTTFTIYLSLKDKIDVDEAEAALNNLIAKILQNGIEDSLVEAAKNRMIANLLYSLDSPAGVANIFGSALSIGMTVQDIEDWSKNVALVSNEEIMEAARYLFLDKKSVTGLLLPGKDIGDAIVNH